MRRTERRQDSTVRTKRSSALECDKSESKIQSVFRAAPIGITFNVARTIHDVNDSMCELTGYSQRELVGHNVRFLYHSETEFERVGRLLYESLDRSDRNTVETSFRRKDGTSISVVLNAALVDREAPEAGYVVTVQDVTASKRAEEALRTSEARFRSIVEQSPFGIQILSARGDVLAVNDAYCALRGGSRESLLGHNILQDELLQGLGCVPLIRLALAGEEVRSPIIKYDIASTASGRLHRAIQSDFYPLKNDLGAVQNVVVVHLDFTERVSAEEERNKLQEQLQQAMKMEAVGRLAGGVAHDFNNLLTSIAGNAELAQMDAGPEHPLAEYLEEIGKAAESAASLTRQLLAFSRRQVIEPRVLNLNALIERMNKMLNRIIGEDVVLGANLAPDVGAVRVDPGQFEQVLVNLAVNARDAMPDGGRLIIETSELDLDDDYCALHPQTAPGRYVVLSVSDTGEGMSKEVQDRIFEPFFTTKPQGKGTGLGLATIFGIVKQSSGATEVYSEPGIGTTFKIYIPRVDGVAQSFESLRPPESPVGGTETILLAEDNESVLFFARTLLGKLGYNLLFAGNGALVLKAAENHRGHIDLLITDVVMPSLNGRELAKRLAELHPETKVLFTSGYTEDVIIHHGVLEKHIQFISKPYSLRSLAAKIRAILDRGRFA
ncbi:MAG TPA: PAS domain S-box protein [Polyangiaceae bacterium]|nr:PAS domain S-box protein [Polyangiaceae bacterium]